MKKFLKLILISAIICSLSLSFSIVANAAEAKNNGLTSRQSEIVEIVKSTNDLSKRNTLLLQAYKKSNYSATDNLNKKIVIDNNTTISFDNDNTFVVNSLKPGKELTRNLNTSGSLTTKDYTNTITRYGPINNVLYTVSVTGYFTGVKGQVPTAHLVNAYYKRGTASMWNVDNWEKGTSRDSSRAYAYGRGNFHYGIEINGQGFHIQDIYENVNVSCNSNFIIYVTD